MTAFVPEPTPQTLGDYRVEALIGSGGMGRVFRACHVEHEEQLAAVKVLHAGFAHDPGFQARFRQEAGVIAALRHPHIVEVFETGSQDDCCYLAMELLPDGSLHTLLQSRVEQPWQLAIGIDLVRQAADVLAFAHARGVVHRDIKPDNLLLIRGEVSDDAPFGYTLKVSDFGLVYLTEGGVRTPTGMTMGTPAYLSPEQCQGLDLDGRSDIYALGVVLYEVVTGYLPFEARTIIDAVFKHVYTPAPSPREVRPDLPEELEQIIMRCLAKHPDERFASASELSRALRLVLRHPALTAPASGTAPLAGPPAPPAEMVVPRVQVRDRRGRTLRVLYLSGEGCIIGRHRDNDLRLRSWWVAPRHAQIDWNGDRASVTDLGSRRGTLLEGRHIAPLVAREWNQQQMLRIGPYWLMLELPFPPPPTSEVVSSISSPSHSVLFSAPGMVALPSLPRPAASAVEAPPKSGPSQPIVVTLPQPSADAERPSQTARASQTAKRPGKIGSIGMALDQERMTLTAGRPSALRVTLVNLGSTVAHVTVVVEGTPGTWIQGPAPTVQLNPSAQETVTLTINVPRAPDSHAGEYPVRMRGQIRDKPDDGGEATAYWTVLPFTGINQVIKPRRAFGWRRASYSVILRNEGNTPARYLLRGEDDEQALEYQLKQERLSLEPGRTAKLKLVVQTQLLVRGRARQHSFTLHARPEGSGDEQVTMAQFVQRALIPSWLLPWLLGLLAMFLLWGFALPPLPTRMQSQVKRFGWAVLNPSVTPTPTKTPPPTLIPTLTPTPTETPVPTEPPSPIPTPPTPEPTAVPTEVPPSPIPTITPLPADQLICRAGVPNVISGVGPPRAPFLLYFDKRAVSGSIVEPNGHYTITLLIGKERSGTYPVTVRDRNTRQVLRRLTCIVP